eukprot:tig00000310_g23985.t1
MVAGPFNSGATTLLKLLNVASIIISGAIIGSGIYAAEEGLLGTGALAWFLVVIGILIAATAILGLVGASKNSPGILFAFFAITITTTTLTVFLAILAFINKDLVEPTFREYCSSHDCVRLWGYSADEAITIFQRAYKVVGALALVCFFILLGCTISAGIVLGLKNIAKRALITFCSLFLILGLALIVGGFLGSKYGLGTTWSSYAIGGLGLALFLVSLLGIIAASRESEALLNIYLAVLFIISIILFAAGVAAFLNGAKVQDYVTTHAEDPQFQGVFKTLTTEQQRSLAGFAVKTIGLAGIISAIVVVVGIVFTFNLKSNVGYKASAYRYGQQV